MTEQPGHPYYLRDHDKLAAEQGRMAEAGRAFAAERYGKALALSLIHI